MLQELYVPKHVCVCAAPLCSVTGHTSCTQHATKVQQAWAGLARISHSNSQTTHVFSCWLAGTLNAFQAVFISNNIGGLGPLQMNSLSYNFTSCEWAARAVLLLAHQQLLCSPTAISHFMYKVIFIQ